MPLFKLFALTCIAVPAFTLCGLLTPTGKDDPDMPAFDIEAFIGTPLPASAYDVRTHTESGIDDLLLLRFSLPADDLDSWVEALDLDLTLRSGYNPLQPGLGRQLDWWTPGSAVDFVGARATLPGKSYQLLVDITDPDAYTVYLVVFTV